MGVILLLKLVVLYIFEKFTHVSDILKKCLSSIILDMLQLVIIPVKDDIVADN